MSLVGPGAVGDLKTNAGLVMSMTDLKSVIEKRLGGEKYLLKYRRVTEGSELGCAQPVCFSWWRGMHF